MRRERRLRQERRAAAVPQHVRDLLDLVNGSENRHAVERRRWAGFLDRILNWSLNRDDPDAILGLKPLITAGATYGYDLRWKAVIWIWGTRLDDLRRCANPSCRRYFLARDARQRFHVRQCQWDAGNKASIERRKTTMKEVRKTEKRRESLAREAVRRKS